MKIDIILTLTKCCKVCECLCKPLTSTGIFITIELQTPFSIAVSKIWVISGEWVSISGSFRPKNENWYYSRANLMLQSLPMPMQNTHFHRNQYRNLLVNISGHSCVTNLGHTYPASLWEFPDLFIPKMQIDMILTRTKCCEVCQCIYKPLTSTWINIAIELQTPLAKAGQ